MDARKSKECGEATTGSEFAAAPLIIGGGKKRECR